MSNHERDGSRSRAGDDPVDRAWQQVSDERPPPALDAAIIAAARKSTEGRDEPAQVKRATLPQRSWLTRWQPLAAAAAVAGLAFVLVQSLPRDRDVAQESVTAPASTNDEKLEADTVTTMRATEVEQRQLAAPAMSGRPASEAAAAPAPVQTTAAKAAASAAREDVAQPDATERAARITSLYAAGDIAGAADALREFRAVDPGADTYLPGSLRDWAQTVE